MSLLVWNPEWNTGIDLIDEQHQSLLCQVEEIMEAVHLDDVDRRIPALLDFLAVYVEQHFRLEEGKMEAAGYAGLAGHRAIHDDMRQRVATLIAQNRLDPKVVTDAVVDFLTDWLVKHINGEDRRMAKHLIQWAAAHPEGRA